MLTETKIIAGLKSGSDEAVEAIVNDLGDGQHDLFTRASSFYQGFSTAIINRAVTLVHPASGVIFGFETRFTESS